jgi:archaellum component FlaG (FlaF/FlaG flagellin family)
MADSKISALTGASTPLAGTEVLPIVQSGSTRKVVADDLTVKNIRSNSSTGILQVTGPAAASTRTMTVPNANFTAARTDAAQTFTGVQTMTDPNLISTLNAQTGTTYTLASADVGKVVTLSNTSAITLTIDTNANVPVSTGASVTLVQYNTGQVTVVGAGGVTLRSTPGAKLRAQYSAGSLIKIAADEWLLVGDLTS